MATQWTLQRTTALERVPPLENYEPPVLKAYRTSGTQGVISWHSTPGTGSCAYADTELAQQNTLVTPKSRGLYGKREVVGGGRVRQESAALGIQAAIPIRARRMAAATPMSARSGRRPVFSVLLVFPFRC